MQTPNGKDQPTRLERLEDLIQVLTNRHILFEDRFIDFENEHLEFQREHKQLLTAQVVLNDQLQKVPEMQLAVVDGIVQRPRLQ